MFILEAKLLQGTRVRVRANDPALAPALAKLRADTDSAMKLGPFSVVDKPQAPPSGDKHDYMSQAPYFWPNPDTPTSMPYVRRDGERNPDILKIPDRIAMRNMSNAVQTLSLAYYFTGDEKYADRAALLLRTWFIDAKTRMNPNLQFAQAIPGQNTGRGIGIIESGSLVSVIDALALLSGSKSWTDDDQRALVQWFDQYLTWLTESTPGKEESAMKNNHGTHYDVQVVTYALFVGKPDVAKRVLQDVLPKRIATQIEPDGKQPLELERTKAWSYSAMNLRGLMQLARLGEHVDVDLWHARTDDGRSIRTALDYLVPFATDPEQKWPHQQLNGFRSDAVLILMRRAASEYPDAQYGEMLKKLPPLPPERLDHLVGPRLVANEQDQQ